MSTQEDPTILALDAAIERAESARADLDVEIKGLHLARERRLRDLAAQSAEVFRDTVNIVTEYVTAEVAKWRSLPRTEAVLLMLQVSGGQAHRKDLTERLIGAGRTDETIEAVSATLAYLAREPGARVAAMGNGVWQLTPAIFDSGPAGNAERDAYAAGHVRDIEGELGDIVSGGPQPENSGGA
jgi:hypothetical protein